MSKRPLDNLDVSVIGQQPPQHTQYAEQRAHILLARVFQPREPVIERLHHAAPC